MGLPVRGQATPKDHSKALTPTMAKGRRDDRFPSAETRVASAAIPSTTSESHRERQFHFARDETIKGLRRLTNCTYGHCHDYVE
ncbi:hypothetical protein Zmor_018491 [Zophobas morio]|uniref:Uncharacterized protein n=1 Tax=Zophobas morio TaxID=2755281 RepID=A0AA38MDX4_9CUCU|nr:hypothetical protein Zmor_018491 [Zophobas morio]